MENCLAFAQGLDKQHPDTWTRGQWYPAVNTDGSKVQIKRTTGRGRSRNNFLHIRRECAVYISNADGSNRRYSGQGYNHGRVNLRTGAFTWLDW